MTRPLSQVLLSSCTPEGVHLADEGNGAGRFARVWHLEQCAVQVWVELFAHRPVLLHAVCFERLQTNLQNQCIVTFVFGPRKATRVLAS